MTAPSRSTSYRFDRAQLQPAQRRLLIDDKLVTITPRAFDLLVLLVERAGDLVTKEEILDRIWAGLVVEENNLQVQVSTLRKALGAAAIETVPGQGYRFRALVTVEEAAPSAAPARSNVPRPLTTFVQRDGQLAECIGLLERTRLLTLTGVGGLGKTRLSLEMASACEGRYSDGVWFVDLAPVDDARRVSEAVALVMGVVEQTAERLLDVMQKFVRDRRMLLILDNCEHVLRGCAEIVKRLLHGGANVKILATSREPLHVTGEAIYAVPTLRFPSADAEVSLAELAAYDAVRLFVERAAAAQPDFRLAESNARAVREICARLDGIPLALELAAARVRVAPVDTIAERLQDRFRLLTRGDRTAPTRQQTLRATLDWSYALLSEPEQRVLQRVSVFAGGWTLEAAEEVCAGDGIDSVEVLDLQGELVDKSLVVLDARDARYGLLETVRQYAQERLEASGEGRAARDRHLEVHVALADRVEPKLVGPEEQFWLARLDAERDNLLAAYAWSRTADGGAEAALRLAYGARRWMCRGAFDLGRPILARELQQTDSGKITDLRTRGLLAAAFLSYYAGHLDDSRRYAEAAVAGARALGSASLIAHALSILGSGYIGTDNATARRYLVEALELARREGDQPMVADMLNFVGELASVEGDLEAAETWYEEALAADRALGAYVFTTVAQLNLARIAICRGDARAAALLLEALALAGGGGVNRQAPYFLSFCAALAAGAGDPARAARFFGAAKRSLDEMMLVFEPADEQAIMPLIAKARSALTPEAFAAAEAEGHALRRDDALREIQTWLRSIG